MNRTGVHDSVARSGVSATPRFEELTHSRTHNKVSEPDGSVAAELIPHRGGGNLPA